MNEAQSIVCLAVWPIRILSSSNEREHWRPKAKRAARERGDACMFARATLRTPQAWPIVVTLTRIGSTFIRDEHENLPVGCKSVVDGIADFFGIDDGDKTKVRWVYAQRKPEPNDMGSVLVNVSKTGRKTFYGVAVDVRVEASP